MIQRLERLEKLNKLIPKLELELKNLETIGK